MKKFRMIVVLALLPAICGCTALEVVAACAVPAESFIVQALDPAPAPFDPTPNPSFAHPAPPMLMLTVGAPGTPDVPTMPYKLVITHGATVWTDAPCTVEFDGPTATITGTTAPGPVTFTIKPAGPASPLPAPTAPAPGPDVRPTPPAPAAPHAPAPGPDGRPTPPAPAAPPAPAPGPDVRPTPPAPAAPPAPAPGPDVRPTRAAPTAGPDATTGPDAPVRKPRHAPNR